MSSPNPGSTMPAYGEPRPVGGLRTLVPANVGEDDDDLGAEASCVCVGRGSSPKKVTFVDDVLNEAMILETPSEDNLNEEVISSPCNESRKKSKKKSAASSIPQCCCKLDAASSDPGSRRKGSVSPDFEFLYKPGTEKSDALKRHTCGVHMKAQSPKRGATADSCASMPAGMPPSGAAKTGHGPCSPRQRVTPCEDLVERRQPSWWEPALSRVLSVLVSTILLLAADGPVPPSPDHLAWTREFLECVRDREDKSPPNVAGLLAYIDQNVTDHPNNNTEGAESP